MADILSRPQCVNRHYFNCPRLLEVNGTMVFSGTDIEVQQAIKNAKSSVNIVALRDNNQPIMSAVSDEEVAGLKEDLSLAMMEVETLTQDNQDLTREMSKYVYQLYVICIS